MYPIYTFISFCFYLFICLFSLEKFCTLSYRFCLIKFKRKFDKQNLGKFKIKTTTMTTKSYSVSTINWAVPMFIKFQTHGTCFAFEHRFEILEVLFDNQLIFRGLKLNNFFLLFRTIQPSIAGFICNEIPHLCTVIYNYHWIVFKVFFLSIMMCSTLASFVVNEELFLTLNTHIHSVILAFMKYKFMVLCQ